MTGGTQREAETKHKLCLLKWSECQLLWKARPLQGEWSANISYSTEHRRREDGGVFLGGIWLCLPVWVCVPTCAGEGETWGVNLGEVTESEKGGVYLSGRWAEGKFVFTITGRESCLRFICNLLYMHVHAVGHAWLLGAMKREERRPTLVSVNEEGRWGGSTELNIHAHDHIRVYGKVNMHL